MSVLLISWMVAAATIAALVAAAWRNRQNGYRKPQAELPLMLEAAAWLWSVADEEPEAQTPETAASCAADLAALSDHVLPKPAVTAAAEAELVHR
jgi:hypothetical protein